LSARTRRYFFGDGQTNALDGRAGNGNSVADHLYGMAGNDVLIGGQGDDLLDGGTGFDSYVWTSTSGFFGSNDGDDRIVDADKKGRLLINGSAAKLLIQKTDTTWVSADEKLTLTQPADSSSGWVLSIADGGSLDLGSSFTDGDYGVYRLDGPATYSETPTLLGDKAPKEFSADFTGPVNAANHGADWVEPTITVTAQHTDEGGVSVVDAYTVTYKKRDALGNLVTEGPSPDRADTLKGGDSADYISAGGGDDEIDAEGGNDRIDAGAGSDRLTAGDGRDLLEGGAGADILFGEGDADTLWGDTAPGGAAPLAAAIAAGNADDSINATGDWIDGGTGDDVLIGSAAKDVIVAGLENDLLIGGA